MENLPPNVVILSDDEEEVKHKTGKPSSQHDRTRKRRFIDLSDNPDHRFQAAEEQSSSSTSPMRSSTLQNSSKRMKSAQSLSHSARDTPARRSTFRATLNVSSEHSSRAIVDANVLSNSTSGYQSRPYISGSSSRQHPVLHVDEYAVPTTNSQNQVLQDLVSGQHSANQERALVINLDDDEVVNDDESLDDDDVLDNVEVLHDDEILDDDEALDDDEVSTRTNIRNYLSDADFEKLMISLQEPEPRRRTRAPSLRLRNNTSIVPRVTLRQFPYNNFLLHAGLSVELRDGHFMRILYIQQDPTTMKVLLIGQLFRRSTLMSGEIGTEINEVCWILHVKKSNLQTDEEQALQEIDVTEVVKPRTLKLTNQPFPRLSFRDEFSNEPKTVTENERDLVCRWKCVFGSKLAKDIYGEKAFLVLRKHECDSNYGVGHDSLREDFRGEAFKGGASERMLANEQAHAEIEKNLARKASNAFREHRTTSTVNNHSFTYGTRNGRVIGTSRSRPIGVDPQLSRLSLEPAEVGANNRGSLSNATSNTRGNIVRVPSNRPRVSPQVPTSSLEFPIDLTHDTNPDAELYPRSDAYISPRAVRFFAEGANNTTIYDEPNKQDLLEIRSRKHQRYTFGDGFCGCGGVSRGATIAGLRLEWAFDFEQPMCRSYEKNFPTTEVICTEAFDFATNPDYNARVDVLHLSPPCQFFSPAHTVEGVNDERNTAASLGILELVKKTKPRVVTLENTMGLQQKRHEKYLHGVINQFTTLGFSVRWKVVDLRDFGVPQSRKRLIMIAACPGELLPEFPEPTHAKAPQASGLKPWATINEAIAGIPSGWPNHDKRKTRKRPRPPFDGNTQAKCMTTSGGDNYHPSGLRNYTVREFACLQTFPMEHMWPVASATLLKQQIGNSVPPVYYAVLARKIVQTLKRTDGLLGDDDER